MSASYPEGNFGGNQLLDGSISLSPLYPSHAIDLHVRTASGLHRVSSGFALLRHSSPSFGSQRVHSCSARWRSSWNGPVVRPSSSPDFGISPKTPKRFSLSLRPTGFVRPLRLAHVLDSLVRVSRRVRQATDRFAADPSNTHRRFKRIT